MLQALALDPGDRLLDAGCGGGEFLAQAAARGAVVSGIDAAPGMLAIAHERVPDAELYEGDITALPFADDAFDVATAFNAIQFTGDLPAAVAELGRVAHRVAICNWTEPSELPPLFAALAGSDVSPAATDVASPASSSACSPPPASRSTSPRTSRRPTRPPTSIALITALREGSGLTGDIESLAAPNRRPDGSYRFENRFRYVLATRS